GGLLRPSHREQQAAVERDGVRVVGRELYRPLVAGQRLRVATELGQDEALETQELRVVRGEAQSLLETGQRRLDVELPQRSALAQPFLWADGFGRRRRGRGEARAGREQVGELGAHVGEAVGPSRWI